MTDEQNCAQGSDLNQQKLQRMCYKIYSREKQNVVTNDKTNNEMIEEIVKIIEQEDKKCY